MITKMSTLLKQSFALCVVATSLFGATAAQASELFTFNFVGSTVQGSFDLLASLNSDNSSYTATSGSLTFNTASEAYNLISNPNGTSWATSPSGSFYYSNQIYPDGSQFFDLGGLLFSSLAHEVNIYGNGPGNYTFYMSDNITGVSYNFNEPISISFRLARASEVPEPTTVALLGLGLFGFAAFRRKEAKKS